MNRRLHMLDPSLRRDPVACIAALSAQGQSVWRRRNWVVARDIGPSHWIVPRSCTRSALRRRFRPPSHGLPGFLASCLGIHRPASCRVLLALGPSRHINQSAGSWRATSETGDGKGKGEFHCDTLSGVLREERRALSAPQRLANRVATILLQELPKSARSVAAAETL